MRISLKAVLEREINAAVYGTLIFGPTSSIGNSTFVKEFAERIKSSGHPCQEIEINVENVNTIIQQNFDMTPDFFAIDAESMDYDILSDWDYCKYPFKGVICEIMEEHESKICELMMRRGYRIYARTLENIIWARNDLKICV